MQRITSVLHMAQILNILSYIDTQRKSATLSRTFSIYSKNYILEDSSNFCSTATRISFGVPPERINVSEFEARLEAT